MKEIKIVDQLAISAKATPIELLYCLQVSYSDEKLPIWCKISTPTMSMIKQLTRVGTHQIGCDTLDVIIAHMSDDSQTYWLGEWNDGVV
jgi:hypothetical protein